jgi:hypothetical protein
MADAIAARLLPRLWPGDKQFLGATEEEIIQVIGCAGALETHFTRACAVWIA